MFSFIARVTSRGIRVMVHDHLGSAIAPTNDAADSPHVEAAVDPRCGPRYVSISPSGPTSGKLPLSANSDPGFSSKAS